MASQNLLRFALKLLGYFFLHWHGEVMKSGVVGIDLTFTPKPRSDSTVNPLSDLYFCNARHRGLRIQFASVVLGVFVSVGESVVVADTVKLTYILPTSATPFLDDHMIRRSSDDPDLFAAPFEDFLSHRAFSFKSHGA